MTTMVTMIIVYGSKCICKSQSSKLLVLFSRNITTKKLFYILNGLPSAKMNATCVLSFTHLLNTYFVLTFLQLHCIWISFQSPIRFHDFALSSLVCLSSETHSELNISTSWMSFLCIKLFVHRSGGNQLYLSFIHAMSLLIVFLNLKGRQAGPKNFVNHLWERKSDETFNKTVQERRSAVKIPHHWDSLKGMGF